MLKDMLKLDIKSLAYGGRGFSRTDEGQAVFVSHVIPGETVNAKIVKKHASYLEAVPKEIIEVSPYRVEPVCKYFTSCGGCDWQHIQYSEQIKWKDAIVKNHLRKVISGQHTECYPPESSPKEYEYRNHIHLQCNSSSAGFYMQNTNNIVLINDCPIAERKIRDILPLLIQKIFNISFRDKLTAFELFALGDGAHIIVHSVQKIDNKMVTEISSICKDLNISGAAIVNLALHTQEFIGDVFFRYNIETIERKFSITGGLGGFIQANLYVNQLMVEHVLDSVKGSEKVLDLYCGCGNFTIPLASVCQEVTGIDHDSRLTSFVLKNANINGMENLHVITSDIKSSLDKMTVHESKYDTVIMDPPRTGALNLLSGINRIKPDKIVYISCNVSTLARDLYVFQNSGYMLKSLRMFDMFPQTYHIETVSCLEHQ
jgi:23S rRNA (uracil1939-C5)-methyltransferase